MTFGKVGRPTVAGLALSSVLLAASPAAPGEDALTPRQKSAIEEVVRDYLRQNPEILVEAIRALQIKQEMDKRARTRAALIKERDRIYNDPTSPVGGNPDGDVTVVEFFDYQCPYCKKVFPAILSLMESDGNIRYVFKEYPILGRESVIAARAALAAWNIDKQRYMAFHSAMMVAKGALGEARIMKIAARSGLDVKRLREVMNGPEVEAALRSNFALAEALGVNGTPAFVIGEELVPGAADLASLKRLIAAARKG